MNMRKTGQFVLEIILWLLRPEILLFTVLSLIYIATKNVSPEDRGYIPFFILLIWLGQEIRKRIVAKGIMDLYEKKSKNFKFIWLLIWLGISVALTGFTYISW